MAERNWKRNTPALVGMLLGILSIGMAWANHAATYHSQQEQQSDQVSQLERSDIPTVQPVAPPQAEPSMTLEPEWFQVIVGAGGLFGLWWTVVFARLAWQAARQSADEAKRAADIAQIELDEARAATIAATAKAFSAERAWMMPFPFSGEAADSIFEGKPLRNGFVISVQWNNLGRSPAGILGAFIDTKLVDRGAPTPEFVPVKTDAAGVSWTGQGSAMTTTEHILDDAEAELLRSGKVDAYAYSCIWYRTPFSDEIHETEFCTLMKFRSGTYVKDGKRLGPLFFEPKGSQNRAT